MFDENDSYDDYRERFQDLQSDDCCSSCGEEYPCPAFCPDCGMDITPTHYCGFPLSSILPRHHCPVLRDTFQNNIYPLTGRYSEDQYDDRDYDDFGHGSRWNSKPF